MKTQVPIIEVMEASKSYAAEAAPVEVLRGITLRIDRGEFASIMGPSGSGKSTLLQIIGGLDVADAGAVRVGGHDLASMTDD
jgi:putative ABC transport system ATP-binding protein